MIMLIATTATIVINFVDEIGADSREYNSAQYHDEKFNNLNDTSVSTGNFFEVLAEYLVFDPSRTPNSVIPTEKFVIQELTGDDVSITWFGHSTILIQSHNTTILMDPILGDGELDPLIFGPSPFAYEHTYDTEDLPQVDYVFISHDHYDHLDMKTIVQFEGSQFLTPLGVKPHLELWGIPSEDISEFDWYEGVNIRSDLQITLTPSHLFSGRSFYDEETLWGSWGL